MQKAGFLMTRLIFWVSKNLGIFLVLFSGDEQTIIDFKRNVLYSVLYRGIKVLVVNGENV